MYVGKRDNARRVARLAAGGQRGRRADREDPAGLGSSPRSPPNTHLHQYHYRPGTISSFISRALDRHARRRRAGAPIRVYMDGCFDVMHYGHANALRQAKALGDELVVGLIPDSEIRRYKVSWSVGMGVAFDETKKRRSLFFQHPSPHPTPLPRAPPSSTTTNAAPWSNP